MSVAEPSFDRIILANPKPLAATAGPRSWIQLARTGSFVSNRYGKFSITKDDLKQMLHNFVHITPKAPTELPVDVDHLSMDPKRPGDGIAAGWMKKLELRDNDQTLWAEVEWTPQGAQWVRDGAYRFVSPSFVKDHTYKDGKKIGTTLLAAAITNHPFLEEMEPVSADFNFSEPSVTLYALNTKGELQFAEVAHLAVDADRGDVINLPFGEYTDFADCVAKNGDKDNPRAYCGWLKNRIEGSEKVNIEALATEWKTVVTTLSEVGQRVMIAPGNARTQDEVGGTFEITEVVGDGENAFVTVKDANGVLHKWFRATELLPASATPANPIQPNLVPASGAAGAEGLPPDAKPPDPNDPAAKTNDPAKAKTNPNAAKGKPNPQVEALIKQRMEQVLKQQGGAKGVPPADPGVVKAATAASKPASGEVGAKDQSTVPDFLKKKKQKGIANMMFKLRNDKNEEIEVSDEQLAAAGIKVVPEGSTAVPNTDLSDMKSTITNLSEKVETLAKETAASRTRGTLLELHSELNRLSKGGFITKATRDALEAQFKDAVDLTAFKALAATFTKPVIELETEHGANGDAPPAKDKTAAEQKLLALSRQIAKERGISLRDAMVEAGKEAADDVEAYQARFRPQEVNA